jgi:hypothetical protein
MMFVRTAVAVICLLTFSPISLAAGEPVTKQFGKVITVYKSPSCECCAGWAQHLRQNGFTVAIVDQYDLSEIKAQHGIGPELQSCHTALVDGFAIEGHVPADDIWRLLAEKPDASGLAAPGMPTMSPGMSSVQPKGYDVLLFGPDSRPSVYSRY